MIILTLSVKHRFNYLKSKGLDFNNKKIADFGSGHGENLFLSKDLGFTQAVGLDFSNKDFLPHEKDLPRESFQAIEFKTLDLVNDPLDIADFDLITSCSAFEHFHDPSKVLDKCYNGLKKGGYFVRRIRCLQFTLCNPSQDIFESLIYKTYSMKTFLLSFSIIF